MRPSAAVPTPGPACPRWRIRSPAGRPRPRHLHEVIDGVEMDLTPRVYATFDELYGYCYRVASAVGLCCLAIWGYSSDGGRAESMAEACGVALQLTNILRDVGEDARNGRVYLPQDELARFGVSTDELTVTRPSKGARALFESQAKRAYSYYEKARAHDEKLVAPSRPAVCRGGDRRDLSGPCSTRSSDAITTSLAGRVRIPGWRKGGDRGWGRCR